MPQPTPVLPHAAPLLPPCSELAEHPDSSTPAVWARLASCHRALDDTDAALNVRVTGLAGGACGPCSAPCCGLRTTCLPCHTACASPQQACFLRALAIAASSELRTQPCCPLPALPLPAGLPDGCAAAGAGPPGLHRCCGGAGRAAPRAGPAGGGRQVSCFVDASFAGGAAHAPAPASPCTQTKRAPHTDAMVCLSPCIQAGSPCAVWQPPQGCCSVHRTMLASPLGNPSPLATSPAGSWQT